MKLYKYLPLESGMLSLRSSTLKVTTIDTYNDPFEGLYSVQKSHTWQEYRAFYWDHFSKSKEFSDHIKKCHPNIKTIPQLNSFKREASVSIIRLMGQTKMFPEPSPKSIASLLEGSLVRNCCFIGSDPRPAPDGSFTHLIGSECLLWSHYAKDHTGVRLTFDFPEDAELNVKFIPIDYDSPRSKLSPIDFRSNTEMGRYFVQEAMRRKAPWWRYENEVRLFTSKDSCIPLNGAAPDINAKDLAYEFCPDHLVSIDFGIKCSPKDEHMKEIRKIYGDISMSRARPSSEDYNIHYESV